MTQRHEEQKRERRRAERDAESVVLRSCAACGNARLSLTKRAGRDWLCCYCDGEDTTPAAHHVVGMHAHERVASRLTRGIDASSLDWAVRNELLWRRDRIEGHAVRAFVAMLREVLS